jgi:hypothetical protein
MRTRILFYLPLLVLGAAACGPSISETRMAYFPPNAESCDLAVIHQALANSANLRAAR